MQTFFGIVLHDTRGSAFGEPQATCSNVLTYIKDMLTHINGICLHISAKSRTFAMRKETKYKPKTQAL